jgi:hypothetical protein
MHRQEPTLESVHVQLHVKIHAGIVCEVADESFGLLEVLWTTALLAPARKPDERNEATQHSLMPLDAGRSRL